MPSIHSILKEHWGYESFRPLQEEIINAVLSREDCLALLPTGGGKSLCFQVPAMSMDGLCLVITPLIALMKDQVENLRRKGITAFSIHAGMSRMDVVATLRTAGNSNCKFLYVSPERLETSVFKEFLPSLGVSLIAVDEAHCISQWGYDFRPAYLKIAAIREELTGVPVLALTASATTSVQEDICEKLLFSKKNIFRQSFERANLSYSVFNVSSKINKVCDVLEKVSGCAIVYCRSRKKTKEISDLLKLKGIVSDYYHAGLSQEERSQKQESWLKDETRVMVCTNAFGMGIDKPSVRVVVHADAPDCIENYYQEAGRAGRDGQRAYAVLLVSANELVQLKEAASKKFPSLEKIREVYRALMNHLQVPSMSGEGNYYEMDAAAFINDFQLDAPTVYAVLKTLEQEELLYFNEQVFLQPGVRVVADRSRMFEFEKEFPALEPLLKTILRSYEGVLDHSVNINEKSLAWVLKKPEEEIKLMLHELHKYAIIEYSPRKDKPQVFLFQNRVKSEDLTIDMRRHLERKKNYDQRVEAMFKYVNSTQCRSQHIGQYFGDQDIRECGICDNCLEKKRDRTGADEFERISGQVLGALHNGPLTIKQLSKTLDTIPEKSLVEVVQFLESEEKIMTTETGALYLKDATFSASAAKP